MQRFCIVIAAIMLILGISSSAAKTKTDWERDELRGKVKTLTVERVTFSEKFGQWEESARVQESVKTYDEQGSAMKMTNYADGVPSIWIIYSHDDSGRLSVADFSDSTGNMVGKEAYAYDSRGDLTEVTHYDRDGSLDQKVVFTFDNSHNATAYVVKGRLFV